MRWGRVSGDEFARRSGVTLNRTAKRKEYSLERVGAVLAAEKAAIGERSKAPAQDATDWTEVRRRRRIGTVDLDEAMRMRNCNASAITMNSLRVQRLNNKARSFLTHNLQSLAAPGKVPLVVYGAGGGLRKGEGKFYY